MYRSRPPARKNHTIPMIPTPFHTPRPKGAANCGATEGSAQSSQSSQIARFARLFLSSLSSLPILLIISYLFISTPASRAAEATDSVRTVTPAPETADTDSLAGAGYTELDDFVIVERKKLLQSDGAKLTYNVTEDPEAGSSNILDILRKVPGVSVDAEDNVKVNGQSSFKILMNGTENPMLKGDLKTVLKSLPAASIKKIEVISEPGAKYEAEGVGGILNIVTDRKTDLSGFLTQLQAWVNAYQVGGYVNGRTKVGKVMLDATVNYNNGNVWPRSISSSRETEDLTGSANHLETTLRKMKSGWDYVGGNASMSWEPDTLNLFTLSAQYGYNTWGNWGDERREMLAPDLTRRWLIERDRDNDGRYNGLGAEASYQHTFGKDGHNLVLSYMYYFSRMHDESSYSTTLFEGSVADAPYSASRDVTNDNNHVFQIDYANPFSPKHLLECGAKVNLVSTRNDSRSLAGPDAPSAVVMPGSEVNMTQFKDIYAVYASYTGTFDKWNAKAGVRYEHTDMGLRYRTAGHDDFTTRLNDVVPNAALSYNFTNASSLRLAYQMRISRPGLWSLNPFVNDLTPGWLQYGNPDLKSEKGHNVSLGYSNYEGKFSGSAKVTYRHTANGINDIVFVRDGVINSTYANVGLRQDVVFDLSGDWNITPDLRWSLYLSATYQYLKANSEMLKAKNIGWQYYANTNITYTMPCKVRLNAYGGFHTPWIDLQSRGSNGYYYGLGANRSFLKDDALTVSVFAGNFAPVSRRNKYTQTSESVRLTNITDYKQWNVGMSISFKFGGLKAGVKKTAANIEKEDSGSKGGGGNK